MYDEIPSLLYVAGALITVLSWTLFRILENHPSRRSKSLHPVPLRYLDIVLCEFDTALVPYPLFEAYSGFMDPDVLDFY